jgi:pyruvate,water dikinase
MQYRSRYEALNMTAEYGVTRFEFDEENDIKNYGVLFTDVTHGTPPFRPLYLMTSWLDGYQGFQKAYERLSVPTSKGWDVRCKDGYPLPAIILVSEEETKARAVVFREKIRPYIVDSLGLWNKRKADLEKDYRDLKAKFGLLESYQGISKLENVELYQMFQDFLVLSVKQWDVHMEFMVPVYYLFGLFEQMCRELVDIDHTDPLFSRLMAGFDSTAFKFNREIWKLGNCAIELKVADTFMKTADNEEVLARLATTASGKQWLADYDEFLKVYGWRCERMDDWATPSWLEKPSMGISSIRMAISTGGTSTIDAKREQAVKDRKQAEQEMLAKVPVDQRDWFQALMKAAQMAGYWSEDHTYYLDLYNGALGRWITLEIGRRFANAGVIDAAEDVYFLIVGEIQRALIPMGKVKLQRYAAARKKEWEGYLKVTPKLFYGDPELMRENVRKDPVISCVACVPKVREELKADLYGGASAPGVAEGIARVVITENELSSVQPGEILVAPATSAPWTPVFEIIKGLVTDGGGALSHAVIVAREYGVPAVTGCLKGTSTIKTGDRLRVDGDLGIVRILR